ncbi:uncharacterized protein DMAD_05094 [Drosophila madeirensis]|uniref:Uncharacterized protein n=1 Tax=Drosophila madeirensis TaxID=30013 RepID=A0AAU9FLJ2_DROMD
MELMGAITEAMKPLRQKAELIHDLGWEDSPNGREGGPTAPEWRRQSTGNRPKGSVEQQEHIPQAPRRFTTPYERRVEWREPRWGRVDKWYIHFDGDPDQAKLTVEDLSFGSNFSRGSVDARGTKSWIICTIL